DVAAHGNEAHLRRVARHTGQAHTVASRLVSGAEDGAVTSPLTAGLSACSRVRSDLADQTPKQRHGSRWAAGPQAPVAIPFAFGSCNGAPGPEGPNPPANVRDRVRLTRRRDLERVDPGPAILNRLLRRLARWADHGIMGYGSVSCPANSVGIDEDYPQ